MVITNLIISSIKTMSKLLLTAVFILSVAACTSSQKKTSNQTDEKKFSYFEISYRGGWFGGLSFFTDNNKIYFFTQISPQNITDKIKYGILPDSITKSIDSTLWLLKKEKLNSISCNDCPSVSIKTITGSDTTNSFQTGEINVNIRKLITQLEVFRDSSAHSSFNSLMILETARQIAPPPPKLP
jgi:hypothetical protein